MSDCAFCSIVAGGAPAHVVDEDDGTLAFLDLAPLTPGHTLVIPKRHTDDFRSVDADTSDTVMRTAHRVAARVRDVLEPDGLNLLQCAREVGFQTVFHLHAHVVPRWEGDTMSLPNWPQPKAQRDELSAMARRLIT